MDISVILTYRCNSKCSMCYIWKYPTSPEYEIDIASLSKLPKGFDFINLTGGEPTLRDDLMEICDLLYPKTNKLEISTNGLHGDKLVPIVKKYPSIKIRISVDGIEEVNNTIRGEQNGYQKKIDSMKNLIKAGGTDLGFATVFQDDNIHQVMDVYRLSKLLNIELATSALHNAFQFHKHDNTPYNRKVIAQMVELLITEMLKSRKIKNWFRAYLNLGLIRKILGQPRLHPCTQGTDSIFIDPWGDVYACNVRNDLRMGNLKNQSWEEIYSGTLSGEIRKKVASCTQNCWMVSSAKTSMRSPIHAKLPKTDVLWWVIYNKIKVTLGGKINFGKYIDYEDIFQNQTIVKRPSFLNIADKRKIQPSQSTYYKQVGEFYNR